MSTGLPESGSAGPRGAVFLSYASQDAAAVARLAEALRACGVEVWFDQNELVGGDAWDAKIRGQIAACALFVPVISAQTQARTEGYFRLEWKLAAQRTHMIADDAAFLLPVVIDETRDVDARVPAEFKAVQWTRLTAGGEDAVFCTRVKKLLGAEAAVASKAIATGPGQRAPRSIARTRRVVAAALVLAVVFLLAVWRPWGHRPPPGPGRSLAPELVSLRARIVPDRWSYADYEVMRPALDRWIQAHPEDADAMALRSYVSSLQVLRTLDFGTKVLKDGKADAERALRIAPGSPLGELALGFHHVAMMTRGGDAEAARPHLERALAALPPDILTRYAQMGYFAFSLQLDRVRQATDTWLREEPEAAFPRWCAAYAALVERKAGEAEKWAEQGIANGESATTIRSISTLFEVNFFLRANLRAARDILDRAPAAARSHHRLVYARWFLALVEHRWDDAAQELARVPDTLLQDRCFRGPKALLVGLAHLKAGRTAPAAAQFREAERMLRELLGNDADDEDLRLALALTLAYQGRADDARSELAAVEPLLRGRKPYLYSGHAREMIAETYAVLGDVAGALPWLRLLFAEPSAVPYTPASFRLDVRFAGILPDSRVQALLAATSATAVPAVGAATKEKSIAVLAFDNRSDDRDAEYFSEGISDELINALGRVPGLTVRGRTSAFFFKGRNATAREIGEKLDVAYLVRGSVRKAGGRVRITAQLSRAATDEIVWTSEPMERELKDVFAVQDEIVGVIAKNLSLNLGVGARTPQSVNPEALNALLEGRHFWTLRTTEGFARARVLFDRAVALDPDWAPARAALANLLTIEASFRRGGREAEGELFAAATGHARRAIALDPALGEPHAALGKIAMDQRRYAEAGDHFRRALALEPSNAMVHDWHADLMMILGRLDAGHAGYARALELDPFAPYIQWDLAWVMLHLRRHREALGLIERAIALTPSGSARLSLRRARLLLETDRRAEAESILREAFAGPAAGSDPQFANEAVWCLLLLGSHPEGEHWRAELLRLNPDGLAGGILLVLRGDIERGLPQLEKTPTIFQQQLYWDPVLDPVRDTAWFRQLMETLGCAAEYRVARATLERLLSPGGAVK